MDGPGMELHVFLIFLFQYVCSMFFNNFSGWWIICDWPVNVFCTYTHAHTHTHIYEIIQCPVFVGRPPNTLKRVGSEKRWRMVTGVRSFTANNLFKIVRMVYSGTTSVIPFEVSHRIHVWYIDHGWLICMVNVCESTNQDPMGIYPWKATSHFTWD